MVSCNGQRTTNNGQRKDYPSLDCAKRDVQQLKTTVVLWGKRVASSTQALLYAEALTYIINPCPRFFSTATSCVSGSGRVVLLVQQLLEGSRYHFTDFLVTLRTQVNVIAVQTLWRFGVVEYRQKI